MTRPRLDRIRVRNYRSISDWVDVVLPSDGPLVLIGENNAGKSNLLRAVNLILGERWPGNYQPEDHEVFGRVIDGMDMQINAEVSGIPCPKGCTHSDVARFIWKFDAGEDPHNCSFDFETTDCNHGGWMSNAVRSSLTCMSVGVERDLAWQLSYGSKWTTLSKLMRRFHAELTKDEDRVDRLKTFYAQLLETFHEISQFSDFASALSEASADFGGNLAYGLDIDFSAYDASNFFRSLRIFPHLDGEARTYDELGTGQEQVLAMAFSYAYAKAFSTDGLILTVDEPENHLHPLAQEWVAPAARCANSAKTEFRSS